MDGKWGYIDRDETRVVDARWDAAAPFSDGLARVLSGNVFGYIDPTGRTVLSPRFHGAGPFSDGLALVEKGGALFYIRPDGTRALEVPYTEATLPDVDRRDVKTILDLSSGEFQKNYMGGGAGSRPSSPTSSGVPGESWISPNTSAVTRSSVSP